MAGSTASAVDRARAAVAEHVPDIQIQQDHVLTNDDMLAQPPLSRGFNLKPHCVSSLAYDEFNPLNITIISTTITRSCIDAGDECRVKVESSHTRTVHDRLPL